MISGLRRLVKQQHIHPEEVVVAFITGAGLKTQEAVTPVIAPPLHIHPTLESFEEALADREGELPETHAELLAAGGRR